MNCHIILHFKNKNRTVGGDKPDGVLTIAGPPSSLISQLSPHLISRTLIIRNHISLSILVSAAGTEELPFALLSDFASRFRRHAPRTLTSQTIRPPGRPLQRNRHESKYPLAQPYIQILHRLETLPDPDYGQAQEKRDKILCREERPQARCLRRMERLPGSNNRLQGGNL